MKPAPEISSPSEKWLYMEDFYVGQKLVSGPVDVTAEEIIAFAKNFDPQDFHTDPEKAKNTVFGEHVASGWHTAALTMRLITMASPNVKGGMIGRSIEKMNWPRPVRPGDKLYLEAEILELRPSGKDPKRGIARIRNVTYNQSHESVMEMESIVFLPRR